MRKPIIGILGNTYKTQPGLFSSAERMYVNSDFQKFGKENVSVREMEQKRTALREKMNKLDKKKAKEVPKRTGNLRPQDLHLGDAVKVLSMNLKGTVSTRPDSASPRAESPPSPHRTAAAW